ncbi:hypothetical protein GCM10022243_19220 [Saccharothrix violaceirubra]|uniref:Uncharacterized protein n=1 Tax=Saccharothrix violaceirubra TaxID=413306 RepID=A0A7W7T2S4_9PSEU|nr:hypothetical protein [Saccharothrix violaceirubra]MBB4965171.1 hypothetical protein [Saccharothrix violaceirubra]
MTGLAEVEQTAEVDTAFTILLHEVAREEAPRLFALVEEYGEPEDVRVAGYGLAYTDRADVNSVEGDFPLKSQDVERARTLFEISSRSAGVHQVHVVWLDETTAVAHQG